VINLFDKSRHHFEWGSLAFTAIVVFAFYDVHQVEHLDQLLQFRELVYIIFLNYYHNYLSSVSAILNYKNFIILDVQD
jgi:hypothetical protein